MARACYGWNWNANLQVSLRNRAAEICVTWPSCLVACASVAPAGTLHSLHTLDPHMNAGDLGQAEQMLTGRWNSAPAAPPARRHWPKVSPSCSHCKQTSAEITLPSDPLLRRRQIRPVSYIRRQIMRIKTVRERGPADSPEITDSFQLSWSLRYSSRRQFSLFSSDSFLLSDSPAGSFSVLDARDRRPSSRRFRDERASFAWKLEIARGETSLSVTELIARQPPRILKCDRVEGRWGLKWSSGTVFLEMEEPVLNLEEIRFSVNLDSLDIKTDTNRGTGYYQFSDFRFEM